jgi:hypothetical protein
MQMTHRNIILSILGVGTLYDLFTTLSGTLQIFQISFLAIVMSLLFTTMIAAMLFYTYEIHSNGSGQGFAGLFRMLWLLAVAYDLWTAFTGNAEFLLNMDYHNLTTQNWKQLIILVGLTIFVSSCPVILSFARNNTRFMRGEML